MSELFKKSNNQQPLLCFAHRGGRGHGTENTLATIEIGLSQKAYGIEIDVWNVDGILLVTHDRRLGRVVQGEGQLLSLKSDDIASLKNYDDSKVPTLIEVLYLVGNKAALNIEIKGPNCAELIAKQLQIFCNTTGISDQNYVISSFDHQQLYWLKENVPQLRRGVLTCNIPTDNAKCCDILGAYSFHPSIDFFNQVLIDDAKKRHAKVFIYTVNDKDDFEILSSMGVDGVFSDYPDRVALFNQSLQE
ncbi:MAG: glycerophosphodiester phosphodiesterase [Cellvibrionaceae bacterium]